MASLRVGYELTLRERHEMREGARAWLGGRGDEDELYLAVERIVERRVAAVLPHYVCAACGTSWTGDVKACPVCPDAATR